jgi:hypothetical protein
MKCLKCFTLFVADAGRRLRRVHPDREGEVPAIVSPQTKGGPARLQAPGHQGTSRGGQLPAL